MLTLFLESKISIEQEKACGTASLLVKLLWTNNLMLAAENARSFFQIFVKN